jgi:stearoyl-CoA desaturase (delta-9 desaturase)
VSIFNVHVAQATASFLGWFLVFYLYHGLGTTLGYHRLLTHKALRVPSWVKYFFVSGGYLGLMGAPIPWVGVHRLHHQKSDNVGDPHSPRDGFKHALYEWMGEMKQYQTTEELLAQTPDLLNDKGLTWLGTHHDSDQGKMCLALSIAFRVLIYFTLGLIPLLANLAATFGSFWSTQFVNVFCHMPNQGYRTHETRDASRNVWWVAILALGEGWHNNHHAIPKSARHGMTFFEVDITWITICLLEKLGWATDIIRPIGISKLNMDALKAKVSDAVASNLSKVNSEVSAGLEQAQLEPVAAYNKND